jgi:hypothetical protein
LEFGTRFTECSSVLFLPGEQLKVSNTEKNHKFGNIVFINSSARKLRSISFLPSA